MPTPRNGLDAVLVGDAIHVAGGGPVMGGGVQSAVHDAFGLGGEGAREPDIPPISRIQDRLDEDVSLS